MTIKCAINKRRALCVAATILFGAAGCESDNPLSPSPEDSSIPTVLTYIDEEVFAHAGAGADSVISTLLLRAPASEVGAPNLAAAMSDCAGDILEDCQSFATVTIYGAYTEAWYAVDRLEHAVVVDGVPAWVAWERNTSQLGSYSSAPDYLETYGTGALHKGSDGSEWEQYYTGPVYSTCTDPEK